MTGSFSFSPTPGIIFGQGSSRSLPENIRIKGRRALLVTGKGSLLANTYGRRLIEEIDAGGTEYDLYSVENEPSPQIVDYAVSKYRMSGIGVVVSVGGGSVLDAGKAISAMLTVDQPVSDYLEGVGAKIHPGTKIPFIAVPTTAGTGSEATKNAVISMVGSNGFKRSLRHEKFVPDIAIVDPLLTVSCSRELTAASGMDCFTQLTESYLSDAGSAYTEALAYKGIAAVVTSLRRAFVNGDDTEARSDIAFAALTSGICLANAGLGTVHGFASSIGAYHNIPHGVICGTLMAPVNEVTVRELRKTGGNHPALEKYATLGRLFSENKEGCNDYFIDLFINSLYMMASELNLTTLKNYGIKDSDKDQIISVTGNKNNPVSLGKEQLEEILNKSIS